MNDTPTPRCDALDDQLQHDPEASRDFELLCFAHLARDLERQLAEATAALENAAYYMRHDKACSTHWFNDGECDCGLPDAWARLQLVVQPLPNPPNEKP